MVTILMCQGTGEAEILTLCLGRRSGGNLAKATRTGTLQIPLFYAAEFCHHKFFATEPVDVQRWHRVAGLGACLSGRDSVILQVKLTIDSADGDIGIVTFSTKDLVKSVLVLYEQVLTQAGFKIT